MRSESEDRRESDLKRLGTTHIIIGATVAKNCDAPAAKLEDEKG